MTELKTKSTLYVVATPIGNLGDITLRALEILKGVDAIAAEDTRHTSGLLSHFGISKKLIAVHEHNENQSAEKLLVHLNAGENIALVTDAGTPGISDPGAVVVDFVRKAGVKVVPIPGVSAVIAALFFGFTTSLQSNLSIIGVSIPSEFMLMVPYIATIIAVSGVVGRVRAPAADGIPYSRGNK